MTSYIPTLVKPAKPPALGPKLAYEIGDLTWIFASVRDKAGNHILTPGRVVFWFDLPDLAQRFYIVRPMDREFIHFFVRDATVMASEPGGTFPYQRTRHDEDKSDGPKMIDWRNA